MNEKEFLLLIKKHSGIVHKIIFLYVDNPQDKKDLYQEILLQAWKSFARFKGESTFSTWIYRVALNTVLSFRRKESKQAEIRKSVEIPVYESRTPSHNSDKLMRAIKELDDINKTIVTLHLEDYSNDEISEVTGLSKGHVSVKLHRIKAQLTERLKSGTKT